MKFCQFVLSDWLKAPEFVPRSRQFLDKSYHPDRMVGANNLSVNTVTGIVLSSNNNIFKQQAPNHVVAVNAAVATCGIPFSPVRTVLDLPQPMLPEQSKWSLSIQYGYWMNF